MTKTFLLIFLWNLDGTIVNNTVMVDECPAIEIVREQFQPMQDMGVIKTWAGYCQEITFSPFNDVEKKVDPEVDA